jgi:RluA family pseudouridine synthase
MKQNLTSRISPPFEVQVVYEDEWLLAVSKPGGLQMHPTNSPASGDISLESLVLERFGAGYVLYHRLDKDTSGIVLLGKPSRERHDVHRKMTQAFEQKKIRKAYLAIVQGEWRREWNRVETSVARAPNGLMQNVAVGTPDSKRALTTFRLILASNDSSTEPRTWIEAMPKTGRTHQIRLHCLYHGCPILGDRYYGTADDGPLALHAYRVDFRHPITDEPIRLIQEPPPSWRDERFRGFDPVRLEDASRRLFRSS